MLVRASVGNLTNAHVLTGQNTLGQGILNAISGEVTYIFTVSKTPSLFKEVFSP